MTSIIVLTIMSYITTIVAYKSYCALLKIKYNSIPLEQLFLFIVCIINSLCFYLKLSCTRLIVSAFMIYLPLLIISIKYKTKLREQLYSFVIIYILINLFDIVADLITYTFIPELSISAVIFINSVIMTTIIYLLFKISLTRKLLLRLKYSMDNNTIIGILFSIILLATYFVIIYDILNNEDLTFKIIILTLIGSILLISIIMVNIYNKYIDYKEYSNNLLINIKGIMDNYNNYRIEKHNINNYLLSLKNMDKTNIIKSINKYLKDNNKCNNNNYLAGIPINISGFLSSKIEKRKNCYIYCDGNLDNEIFENQKIYNELCKTLGIGLDNAFNASSNSKDKNVYIGFMNYNEYFKITIVNAFDNTININKLGTFLYTTKDDGNGIGIYSLKRNKYVKYNIEIKDNKFYLNIIIKK